MSVNRYSNTSNNKNKKNHLAKPKLVQTSFTMTRGESRTLAMEQRRQQENPWNLNLKRIFLDLTAREHFGHASDTSHLHTHRLAWQSLNCMYRVDYIIRDEWTSVQTTINHYLCESLDLLCRRSSWRIPLDSATGKTCVLKDQWSHYRDAAHWQSHLKADILEISIYWFLLDASFVVVVVVSDQSLVHFPVLD